MDQELSGIESYNNLEYSQDKFENVEVEAARKPSKQMKL